MYSAGIIDSAIWVASKIPSVFEVWFLAFNADVEFRIVMTPGDLAKYGLKDVGKKWPKAA
jgi:hypothetical protein